ncbi:DUF1559 domain-containing protein [Aeoliella sp.]|uniref:DUF1559 family PulG-like putative transporter n=1 Tax=Aeoliella sp. TaxID=2795800 RepID=UPI003CCBA338
MTFRLTTLMYLFALVAASLAAFGPVGILVACGVLAFWAGCFYLPGPIARPMWIMGFVLLALTWMMLPAVQTAREAARCSSCANNMKQLMLAIENYESTNQQLPAAANPMGKNGDPASWRLLILPYMSAEGIYQVYNLNEPWNGPKNSKQVVPIVLEVCECPSHHAPSETTYFAVTGPQTAWGNGPPRKLTDTTDGLSYTIMLVESAGRGVYWSEPKDLLFDEAVELLTTPLPADQSDGHRIDNGYFHKPSFVRNVAMGDGSCHRLPVPISREAAIALLTANGGEKIDPAWLGQHPAELDYDRVWGFSVFAVLAILPGVPQLRPWVWPNIPDSAEPETPPRDE